MKMALMSCAALCAVSIAGIAPAQAADGIAPPNQPFVLTGEVAVVKNQNNGYICQSRISGSTGPSVGGTPPRVEGRNIFSFVGTTNFGTCAPLTLEPTTFRITNATSNGGEGVFEGMDWRQNGQIFCRTFGDVRFQFLNASDSSSRLFIQTEPIGGNCTITATLDTAPNADLVQ